MLLTLLEVWVFQHFWGIVVWDAWVGYKDHHHPRVMMFLLVRGQVLPDPYRTHMNK